MRPIFIQIGSINIYSYGLFLALAFLSSLFLIRVELRENGFDSDLAYDLIIHGSIGGIIGARLLYIATHLDIYLSNPWSMLSVSQGLVFYGGLAGGFLAIFWLIKRRELPLLQIADCLAPSLALGNAIGRIGCFMAGCCYGKLLGPDFARILPAIFDLRHPTQLYDLLYNLLIFIFLFFFYKRGRKSGDRFFIFLLLYSIGRFFVEIFRVSEVFILSLTGAQLISLVTLVISLSYLRKKQKDQKSGD